MEELVVEFVCLVQVFLLHVMPDPAVFTVRAYGKRIQDTISTTQQGKALTFFGEQELVDDDVVCIDFVCR